MKTCNIGTTRRSGIVRGTKDRDQTPDRTQRRNNITGNISTTEIQREREREILEIKQSLLLISNIRSVGTTQYPPFLSDRHRQ